jgi:hypothetical protein
MWTPKRMLLLAFGLAQCLVLYAGYDHFLGGIDGLPPLPPSLFPGDAPPVPAAPKSNAINEKLKQAFGNPCPELGWSFKVELHSRNMVVAARSFEILEREKTARRTTASI